MEKFIIAISREYGSGGTHVARKLAAELGIPLYDKSIIEMAAEKSGLSSDYIDRLEDHASSSFLFNIASTAYAPTSMLPQYEVPISYTAFNAQGDVIRELAEKEGSSIVVGRCAEYILRDNPNCIKIFIHADRADRVKFVMDGYNLGEKEAAGKLAKIDKGRANYYRNFTGEAWGSLYAHDLCLNTSRIGVDGAAAVIKAYLKARELI